MATIRVLPPRSGLHPTITINGRVYTCAQGSALDIPDFDAQIAIANDWTICGKTSGTTANRPAKPSRSDTHLDTTLGYIVVFDGFVWRNPATGASV
jgi:hypothetical protein